MVRRRKDTKLPDVAVSQDPLVNWSHVVYDAQHGDPKNAFENVIAAMRYEVGDSVDPWPLALKVLELFKKRFPDNKDELKQLRSIAKRYLKSVKDVRSAGCFSSTRNERCESLELEASNVADESTVFLDTLRVVSEGVESVSDHG